MIYKYLYKLASFFIFLLLLLIVYACNSNKIFAVWTKSTANPILSTSKQSSWFINHILNPYIIKDNEKYNLWFTGDIRFGGRWNIGYGSSQNGIDGWIVNPNPVLSPSGDWETDINLVSIYNEQSIYKTWYNTNKQPWQSGVDRDRIGYATSSSGLIWIKQSHVLKGSDSTSWDSGGADRGLTVLFINGVYHLWYVGTNSDNLEIGSYWRIGYATSTDGINWIKYANNPIFEKTENWEYPNMMYPFVLYEDNKFKMWYGTGPGDMCTNYAYAESTNGYDWTKPADKNPVYEVPGTTGAFDKVGLAGHARIREGDTYKIWYSGYNGSHWTIGYATSPADPNTIPPTPTPIEPVIIVPGMMTSWNKEGILEGQQNPSTPWKILPFVQEYEGLKQTLITLGYQEGKNLFLWPYDWRKSVDTLSAQLNQFIDSTVKPKNPGSKIQLVGHSLGGLVTRAWAQTHSNSTLIHNLMTVATPHKGTVQPYKAWEGGDVDQENSFFSLATRIIIELNRRSLPTTRQVVQNLFPVLKDLLPTESYLKRQLNGLFVNESDMIVRNTWLSNLNTNALPVYPILHTIKGVGFPQTPSTYTIVAPTWLDTILGNWQDGKPVGQDVDDGDAVITSSRSGLDDPSVFLSYNHSNLIAKSDGIKQILQTLEIPVSDSDITQGQETVIQPGLLFLLRSPATLQVTFNGETYTDFDGIIFIPNASYGQYTATVTGTGPGTYRLAVGQFSGGSYSWKEYIGSTSDGKQTTYTMLFSEAALLDDPVVNLTDRERLEEIDAQLADLAKISFSLSISKARFNLKMAIQALAKKDFFTIKKHLEQILLDLSAIRKSNPADAVRLKTFTVSDTLIDAYQAILSKKLYVIDKAALNRLLAFDTAEDKRLSTILEGKSKTGKNITQKAQTFTEGETYKERALKTNSSEIAKKYILLFQTQILFRELGL